MQGPSAVHAPNDGSGGFGGRVQATLDTCGNSSEGLTPQDSLNPRDNDTQIMTHPVLPPLSGGEQESSRPFLHPTRAVHTTQHQASHDPGDLPMRQNNHTPPRNSPPLTYQQPRSQNARREMNPRAHGNQRAQQIQHRKFGKKTRASIKIASLNMRGRYSNGTDKWFHINQIVREKRIGILALQETHVTPEDVASIHQLFGKRLEIISTIDPNHPGAKGVSIVLNKDITNTIGVQRFDIIPGRAIMAKIPWHRERVINILAVYAPNDGAANARFWGELQGKLLTLPKPDVMLGDCNLVEDALDRLPPHPDYQSATEALADLKADLQLTDGWRSIYPDTRAYTFMQKPAQGGAQSRIDRIYAKEDFIRFSKGWSIEPVGISTDHQLISVQLSDAQMPFVGKGRWTLPLFLLKNDKLLAEIQNIGKKLEADIEASKQSRTDEINPQLLFEAFKEKVVGLCRDTAKKSIPHLDKTIADLKNNLKLALNDQQADTEERKLNGSVIQEKINELEQKRYMKARDNVTAKHALECESAGSSSWAKMGKANTPRDTIQELKVPNSNPPVYETRSDKMSKIARDYHNDLQSEGMAQPDIRDIEMENVINYVDVQLSANHKEEMEKYLDEAEVATAINTLPNGKATGINGLPYELWKTLIERKNFELSQNEDALPFDVVRMLTKVYNDIEEYGVSPGSKFAEGWLCPLYKKNDKRDIANYRPITLLNGDYKIFTKALALKLAKTAPSVLHENQAGFIPGRSIAEQIRLTQMIKSFAELDANEAGAIVALDQEKAYDKIAHDYLWKTLQKFNYPDQFIKTVRSLYENAETAVVINGETSLTYKVTRGVRQGDPLSCLLFDLAIEPLAEMLRKSELRGFKAPGMILRVVVTLFADDTTVYLSKEDDFNVLKGILDKWCIASGAKFNITKTEIIPIGPRAYRLEFIHTRQLGHAQDPIPENLNIAVEGAATRILGAWIGNDTDEEGIWTPTIEKINQGLQRWEATHPTIEGRKNVLQWTAAGMTQYLTVVQGMPKGIQDRIHKTSQNFMWDNSGKSSINQETMMAPISQGGKKMVSIEDRNDAIQLMWIKGYLKLGPDRPQWAYFADAIIAKQVQPSPVVKPAAQKNIFTQTWKPIVKHLPKNLKNMLKTAKKFGVRLEATVVSKDLMRQMPVWFHIGANQDLNRLNNYYYANCLRDKHKVTTIGDIETIVIQDFSPEHQEASNCACPYCTANRAQNKCENPSKCHKTATQILQCIAPKWNPIPEQIQRMEDLTPQQKIENREAFKTDKEILFDPAMTLKNNISDGFRVFTAKGNADPNPAVQTLADLADQTEEEATITTHGAYNIDEHGDRMSAGGAWFQDENEQNLSLKITGASTSPDEGELSVLINVLRSVPINRSLHLKIGSKRIIRSLTVDLARLENKGWIGFSDKLLFQAVTAALRQRSTATKISKSLPMENAAGHDGARNLAQQGLTKSTSDVIDTTIPTAFKINGAKLSEMTQALLYQGIQETRKVAPRMQTTIKLDITRHAIKDISGRTPTDVEIWRSIRDKTISRTARGFLWKNVHRAYKIGDHWRSIPNLEQRANCGLCGEEETMEHILLECQNSPAIKIMWDLAKELWMKRERNWPDIRYGSILGCNLAEFRNEKGNLLEGKNRLFTILVTETAHNIWKVRCERVIQREEQPEKYHTESELKNKWLHTINMRLKLDKLHTNISRYGKQAIKESTVLHTWSGVLMDEENLQDNWVWQSGVLVGIKSCRPLGRNR